jgi:hypothetical protein
VADLTEVERLAALMAQHGLTYVRHGDVTLRRPRLASVPVATAPDAAKEPDPFAAKRAHLENLLNRRIPDDELKRYP